MGKRIIFVVAIEIFFWSVAIVSTALLLLVWING